LDLRGGTIDRIQSEEVMISVHALNEYDKVISKMNGGVGMKKTQGPT